MRSLQLIKGTGFVWRGPWSSSTTYSPYDVVSYLSNDYIALGTNTNTAPPGAPWQLMVPQGPAGANGTAGTAGTVGAAGAAGAAGAPGVTWRGAWSSLTTYAARDLVILNGVLYIALGASTNSQPPSGNWDTFTTYGFRWRGAWSSFTTYQVNDVVQLGGSSYIALAASTNSQPPSGSWDLLTQGTAKTQSAQIANFVPSDTSGATVYTNEGALIDIIATLPAWSRGATIPLAVVAAHYLRINNLDGSTVISLSTGVIGSTVAGGYIRSNLPVSSLVIVGTSPGVWGIRDGVGTWNIDQ